MSLKKYENFSFEEWVAKTSFKDNESYTKSHYAPHAVEYANWFMNDLIERQGIFENLDTAQKRGITLADTYLEWYLTGCKKDLRERLDAYRDSLSLVFTGCESPRFRSL